MNSIVEFAKKHGYDNAIYSGEWNGFDVYEPVTNREDVAFTGVPFVILVQGDSIRMSTVDESYERIEYLIDNQ